MTDREKWLLRFGSGWVTYQELVNDPTFHEIYVRLRERMEMLTDVPTQQMKLRDL